MTAISRQSQQCNRIGVIINGFCRLVGREPGVQKKSSIQFTRLLVL